MPRRRFELDPERSRVWIDGSSSVHPIRATASGLEGWVELQVVRGKVGAEPDVSGEVRISVDRLRSGNPVVDRETRRRIDARRHPHIVGRVTGSSRDGSGAIVLEGVIEFRGETASVDGLLTATFEDGELHVTGAQTFDVRQWGLEPPKVGFLRVHPDVEVRLDAVGTPQPG